MPFMNSGKKPPCDLSPLTRAHLTVVFPEHDRPVAAELLVHECGNNLPFLDHADAVALERYRFAALRLSRGQLDRLREAIAVAKTDWRDLLVAAGFAHDTTEHLRWNPATDQEP